MLDGIVGHGTKTHAERLPPPGAFRVLEEVMVIAGGLKMLDWVSMRAGRLCKSQQVSTSQCAHLLGRTCDLRWLTAAVMPGRPRRMALALMVGVRMTVAAAVVASIVNLYVTRPHGYRTAR